MRSTAEETSLWQTPEWERFQKQIGQKARRVSIKGHDFLILIYPLFFGLNYGYIPRPKSWPLESKHLELHQLAQKENLAFLRVDPEIFIAAPKDGNQRSSHSPQPDTTLMLDLQLSEKDLLAQMKRKGRYNIALAEKKQVVVKMAKGEKQRHEFTKIFFNLLQKTTNRDGFSAHGENYYQVMLESLPMSEVFLAFYEDTPLAGAICTFQQHKALYYYGASGNEHRELMAPYLVQWEAIKEAKKRGCTSYDFLGIAPEDAGDDHPWKGISEFKRKFGGAVIHYPKAVDIVFRPLSYKIYKILKKIQKLIKK